MASRAPSPTAGQGFGEGALQINRNTIILSLTAPPRQPPSSPSMALPTIPVTIQPVAQHAAGAAGRVCTTTSGVIVSYRLATRQGDNGYASAQLVGYTTEVNPNALVPPTKPVEPGA